MRKDKTLYFSLLVAAIIFLLLAFNAEASETVVGVAPDPYEAIWETATDEDIRLLACVVWYESARADCPAEVNRAVVETVLNRVLSDEFPETIGGVIRQSGQFSYRDTKIDSKAVSDAIKYVQENGRTVLPSNNYLFFATKKQTIAKNHVWVGLRWNNGKVRKGKGMYFGEAKR